MVAAEHIPLLPVEAHERMVRREASSVPELWGLLDAVRDPELPVVSIWDLGILQDVTVQGTTVLVTITPTYSGCPAMATIEQDIHACLSAAGFDVRVDTQLTPAWTTRWISPAGREALRRYGIAPPLDAADALECPRCASRDVHRISEFGSTACKALYRCGDCQEPFDHFKAF